MNLRQIFLILIFAAISLTMPLPVDRSLGSIHGSPVVAIVHGNSDVLKDDVQGKDSEDDPLEKFGKIVDK